VVQFPVELAVARSSVELPSGSFAFEPKYDGWRLCAHGDRAQDGARLHTRSGTEVTSRFPEIVEAVTALGDVVLDGELVAAVGIPPRLEFTALQPGPDRRKAQGIGVYLLAFDILAADGADLRSLPYPQRRLVLDEVLDQHGASRCSPYPPHRTRRRLKSGWITRSVRPVSKG
jgi:ATP-dependent DNA ligase